MSPARLVAMALAVVVLVAARFIAKSLEVDYRDIMIGALTYLAAYNILKEGGEK